MRIYLKDTILTALVAGLTAFGSLTMAEPLYLSGSTAPLDGEALLQVFENSTAADGADVVEYTTRGATEEWVVESLPAFGDLLPSGLQPSVASSDSRYEASSSLAPALFNDFDPLVLQRPGQGLSRSRIYF